MLCKADTAVFNHPAIGRAKVAVRKEGGWTPRKKKWIQRALLESIVQWCAGHEGYSNFAALCVFAYAFLLRVPSEALPAISGRNRPWGAAKSVLSRIDDELILVLAHRKNKTHAAAAEGAVNFGCG